MRRTGYGQPRKHPQPCYHDTRKKSATRIVGRVHSSTWLSGWGKRLNAVGGLGAHLRVPVPPVRGIRCLGTDGGASTIWSRTSGLSRLRDPDTSGGTSNFPGGFPIQSPFARSRYTIDIAIFCKVRIMADIFSPMSQEDCAFAFPLSHHYRAVLAWGP